MNDQQNRGRPRARGGRLPAGKTGMLPFFVEFVKFATAFAAIIAVALVTLHIASAAM